MKHFIKSILVFAVLFFLIEKVFCLFINHAPEKEYDKRLEMVLNGQMNKDVIILGSSRGANNISAKQLEEELNQSTYNLSYRGTNIEFHEFILKTLMKYNKPPKKLVFVIDDKHTFVDNESIIFRYDKILPYKNYNYINNLLIERKRKTFLSKFLCLARIDRNDFDLTPIKINKFDTLSSNGSAMLSIRNIKQFEYLSELTSYDIENESLRKRNAFKSIQNICKTKNIELIFIFTPNYSKFDKNFFKRFKTLIEAHEKVMIYDTLNPIYKDPEYFYDESHLLKKGAKIFTSELSSFLKQETQN